MLTWYLKGERERKKRQLFPSVKFLLTFHFFLRLCQRRIEERKSTSWGERCVDVFSNLEIIGEGTYGLVYKAKDTTLGKRCFMSIYVAHKRLLCGVHFFRLTVVSYYLRMGHKYTE